MIVYQHIILLWVLIIFKKTLRLGRTFIFYHRFSQLFLSGFATFGMDTYIVQNSSEFFAGSPFLHQDDGAILDVTAIVCLHFFWWCLKWRDPQNSLEIGWCPHFETHAHIYLATALMPGMAGLMKGPSQIVISCDDFDDVIIQKRGIGLHELVVLVL